MVATITVYFHPARSQGSMFQALICAIVAFVYAAFISITSMAVSVLFGDKLDLLVLGHIIVLVVFCGGGLGFVAWTKQRLSDPLVNVASSLASLAIITILTKEGAVQAADFSFEKIGMVLKMVLMGIVFTMAVNLTIFPVSARRKLRQNMVDVTDSLSDLLGLITSSFLTGREEELQRPAFIEASERHKKSSSALKTNLKEAKNEHYVYGTERQYRLEARIVSCMQHLAQSIGGLRSAASTQFLLLKQPAAHGTATPINGGLKSVSSAHWPEAVSMSLSPPNENSALTAIEEVSETESAAAMEDSSGNISPYTNGETVAESGSISTAQSPADIFSRFIQHLGPSMVGLR